MSTPEDYQQAASEIAQGFAEVLSFADEPSCAYYKAGVEMLSHGILLALVLLSQARRDA